MKKNKLLTQNKWIGCKNIILSERSYIRNTANPMIPFVWNFPKRPVSRSRAE